MEEERLIQAIESVRRDKKDPWRYIFFTFLNGIAQGLGVVLGMTIVLAVVILILTNVIATMINFPVIGHYFESIGKLIDESVKSFPKTR